MQGVVFLFEVPDLCRSGEGLSAFGPPGFRMLGEGRGLMTSDLGTFLAEVTGLPPKKGAQAVGSMESGFSHVVDAL